MPIFGCKTLDRLSFLILTFIMFITFSFTLVRYQQVPIPRAGAKSQKHQVIPFIVPILHYFHWPKTKNTTEQEYQYQEHQVQEYQELVPNAPSYCVYSTYFALFSLAKNIPFPCFQKKIANIR